MFGAQQHFEVEVEAPTRQGWGYDTKGFGFEINKCFLFFFFFLLFFFQGLSLANKIRGQKRIEVLCTLAVNSSFWFVGDFFFFFSLMGDLFFTRPCCRSQNRTYRQRFVVLHSPCRKPFHLLQQRVALLDRCWDGRQCKTCYEKKKLLVSTFSHSTHNDRCEEGLRS